MSWNASSGCCFLLDPLATRTTKPMPITDHRMIVNHGVHGAWIASDIAQAINASATTTHVPILIRR